MSRFREMSLSSFAYWRKPQACFGFFTHGITILQVLRRPGTRFSFQNWKSFRINNCFHVTIFYRRYLRRTSGNVLKSEWFQKVMKIICMHWKLIMVYVYISWYVNCLVHDATGLVRRSCWPVSCSKKYIWCTVHTKKTWFNSTWMFFGILLERTANPCPPTWRGDPLFGWLFWCGFRVGTG